MTRAEAINTLANFKVYISGGGVIDKKANEALDMAIEALNCSEIPNKSDTISRSAAIDALKVAYWDKEIQSAKDDPCIVDAMTDWAIRMIKELPSAQPEQKKGKWILECDAEGEGDNLYRCPECGCNYSCQEYDIPNFCPNCGSYNGGENHDKG